MHRKAKILNSVNRSPYYSAEKCTFDSIADFPIITKQIVSNNNDMFIVNDAIPHKLMSVLTSGSTGVPMRILWDPLDYCASLAELWKIRKAYGIYPNDRYVSYHAVLYNSLNGIHNRAIIQKNNLSLSQTSLSRSTFEYYYNLVKSFHPRFMMLPPSFLFGFIIFLKGEKLKLPESIKLIELVGEKCEEELYLWFQEQYPDIIWRILYGMQEFNGIAYGSNEGLRIIEKNVFVETVNETGEATNIGEEGNIIVTGLKNAVFPLIRYKTEDRGFFDSKGFLHITMSRSNDCLYYQGKVFDGSIFWASILHLQQRLNICIGQFQVRHKCNVVHVLLLINNKLQQSNTLLAELISEFLFVKFQIKIKVIVEIVDNIAVEGDKNKLKYFINEDCCEVKTNGK